MTPEQMERELDRAAAILQTVLPIGSVKHIGHREVADGVQMLADTVRRLSDKASSILHCASALYPTIIARASRDDTPDDLAIEALDYAGALYEVWYQYYGCEDDAA